MPRLRRSDCSAPGIRRRRRGRGFEYIDERTGEPVRDPDTLQRIRDLVLPPAWRDVWICPIANGHLQAVGIDAAGRKQYRYHEGWRTRRDMQKFDRMLQFARGLPQLREHCRLALTSSDELTRERVLACAVRLLDLGFFRVGGETYAEENETYGLATMRRKHVSVEGNRVCFDYVAKGSKQRVQSVVDPDVAQVVRELKYRKGGGQELLAYCADGRWVDITSRDINEEIKRIIGPQFSAKDFRTWAATVLAAVALGVSGSVGSSQTARKRAMARAAEEVAHYLGNTPTVCRKSYIDPRVFDRYLSGWTIGGVMEEIGHLDGELGTQGAVEEAVLDLLERRHESDAVERVGELRQIA